jgi:Flp pilus assembly protein TadG
MMKMIKTIYRCERGVAATEFALALPFIIALMLGGFELSRYVIIHQKLEKVAYTIADVVSQSDSVTTAQLDQAVMAAGTIMEPTDFEANGTVMVSSVSKTGSNAPVVRWQYAGGGIGIGVSRVGAVNAPASLPNGLTLNDGDNVIIAEVFFSYEPFFFGGLFSANQALYKVTLFKPRLGALVSAPT